MTVIYNIIMTKLPGSSISYHVTNGEAGESIVPGDSIPISLVGNTGDIVPVTDDMTVNSLTTTAALNIGTDLNHDGTKIGFFATAPVVKTALVDAGALTSATLTDSSTGTPSQTIAAVSGSGDDVNINNIISSLTDEVNKLTADMVLVRAALNAALDAFQTYGY